MKPKRKKPEARREPTAPSVAQIAKTAGLSISRVYRKLAEGRTPAQIIAAAQLRAEQMALKQFPPAPVVTNGHAGVLTFAAAQTEKETWAARLKEGEFLERKGELVPVVQVRLFCSKLLVAARDEFLRTPSELADVLAGESNPHEVERILRTALERSIQKLVEMDALWHPPAGAVA
jgi:hypothetical protein